MGTLWRFYELRAAARRARAEMLAIMTTTYSAPAQVIEIKLGFDE